MKAPELEERQAFPLNNLSILKTGKAKAVRFSTAHEFAGRCSVQLAIF